MAWLGACSIERWSRCARALAAVCVRARSAVGCLARRARQRSSWVRAFTQNACKKFFSSSSSHPSPALARGLLLPILYCVNRAPPENRMIMRFLPFHFCNPLQTDVNRLQTDAFSLQLRAFWTHLRVTSLRPTCNWLRSGCNGNFAKNSPGQEMK